MTPREIALECVRALVALVAVVGWSALILLTGPVVQRLIRGWEGGGP